MYKDKDFDENSKISFNYEELIKDLNLNVLFEAMSMGDEFLYEISKKALLSNVNDVDTILYRQNILKDCINNSLVIRNLYDIANEAITNKKKYYFGFFTRYPAAILDSSIDILNMFVDMLKKIKSISDEHSNKFSSEGFINFFKMIDREFDNEYFKKVENCLKELRLRDGVLIRMELGAGNKGINPMLCKIQNDKGSFFEKIFTNKKPSYSFYIDDRDESGARILSEIRDKGINEVANTIAKSAEHILNFFIMLKTELSFYISCLNLYNRLLELGIKTTFPIPLNADIRKHSFKGLYDICLSLEKNSSVVGNDLDSENKELYIITGANQGGKSTYLRSIGLSQIMMQCGMFVGAEYYCANICEGIFTHYKREEDVSMRSGKLDEELRRMSSIIDNIKPNSIIFFNESFSATNEREGSLIAKDIVLSLVEKKIKVFFVTHFFEFAHGLYEKNFENAVFLRAQRQKDGSRTFKIEEGEPLKTSFGEDIYKRIFENK